MRLTQIGHVTPDLASGSIFFVGTATVIIRYAGFTILTDPNILHKGDHVHRGYGMTAERLTEPALSFEQLPPVDFVLLSHMHGDHFDTSSASGSQGRRQSSPRVMPRRH